MIETFDKQRIICITLILDIALLYVVAVSSLNLFDSLFVIFVFICHTLFYLSIYYNAYLWLDYLHYSIFLSLFISFLLQNKWLLSICLFLLTVIQVLWIQEERCILLNDDSLITFGYGKELWYATLLYSIFVSAKIGYIWKND